MVRVGFPKWEGGVNPFVVSRSPNIFKFAKPLIQKAGPKNIQHNSPNIFLQISKYENMQLPKYLLTDHQICKYAVLQISSYRWPLQLLQARIRGLGWGWWVDFKLWYLYCELFHLISSFHICISDLIFSSDIFNADLSNYFPLLKLFLLLTWFWAQIFPCRKGGKWAFRWEVCVKSLKAMSTWPPEMRRGARWWYGIQI